MCQLCVYLHGGTHWECGCVTGAENLVRSHKRGDQLRLDDIRVRHREEREGKTTQEGTCEFTHFVSFRNLLPNIYSVYHAIQQGSDVSWELKLMITHSANQQINNTNFFKLDCFNLFYALNIQWKFTCMWYINLLATWFHPYNLPHGQMTKNVNTIRKCFWLRGNSYLKK